MNAPTPTDTRTAFSTLEAAGFRLAVLDRDGPMGLSVRKAAERLDTTPDWIRDHLDEFPNTFRLGSDLRITAADIRKFAERHRVFKA